MVRFRPVVWVLLLSQLRLAKATAALPWALPAQVLAAAMDDPGPPPYIPCENPLVQIVSLCTFYVSMGGREWRDRTGWDKCDAVLLDWAVNGINMTTGNCTLQLGESLQAGQSTSWGGQLDVPLSSGLAQPRSLTMPEACCWHGVTCCDSFVCDNALDSPVACNCTPGTVVAVSLEDNNLVGDLEGQNLTGRYAGIQAHLPCTVRSLSLQNNYIHGTLPSRLTNLDRLWVLGLGYNRVSGTIPASISELTALRVLELTHNNISGSVPWDICGPSDAIISHLTDLLLANNQLTGTLNISRCVSLIMIDIAANRFSGIAAGSSFFPQLHVLLLQNNYIQFKQLHLELSRARFLSEISLGYNNMNGSLPDSLSSQFYLTTLNLEHNDVTGSIPTYLFNNLGALNTLDLSDNGITGSLPASIGRASSLYRLDVANNYLTGVLPDSLIMIMATGNSYLDIRSTFLSCCGSNFTLYPNGTGRYQSMDYSRPRLPRGLAFSKTLRPVTSTKHRVTADNASSLNCPFIMLDPLIVVDIARYPAVIADDPDQALLVSWFFNPAYTLYEGCSCQAGSDLVNDTDMQLVYCVQVTLSSDSHIWVIAAVLGSVLGVVMVLWLMFFRGTRPILVQNWLDMRKRLKGAPQGGMVSIVVTDIEGFSDLMKLSPDLTTKALLIHNSLIRKAMWTNFGNTIEQEGDSFSVVFHEAQDAVRFCLQVQLMLANQAWPAGLFDGKHEGVDPTLRKKLLAASVRLKHNKLLKRLYQSLRANSGDAVAQGASRQALDKCSVPASDNSNGSNGVSRVSNAGRGVAVPPVPGLRVRMGIATGEVSLAMTLVTSRAMELSKFVSDAAAGGQILMCSSTFQAVRTLTRELGCVDLNGLNQSKLNSNNRWMTCWWSKAQQQEEATLLNMGQYLHCKPGTTVPVVLTRELLQLTLMTESSRFKTFSAPPTGSRRRFTRNSTSMSQESEQLYQVLAPSQVSRGRFFGSKLSLKEEWVPLDVPYFSAPGALLAPLTSSDFVPSHLSLPLVTMVFCMVDGGKQYAARNRRDAQAVHAELVALTRSVLRQIPGSYYVKGQDGDLKYMVAFDDPRAALSWCLAVQECAMYLDWPASALQQWPEERSTDSQLLFRGPRLKMGVCEGTPRSILPDYNGRADYLGDSVNQAARFMDAAAHGGQVACKTTTVMHILSSMSSSFRMPVTTPGERPSPTGSWPSSAAPQTQNRSTLSSMKEDEVAEEQSEQSEKDMRGVSGQASLRQLATCCEDEVEGDQADTAAVDAWPVCEGSGNAAQQQPAASTAAEAAWQHSGTPALTIKLNMPQMSRAHRPTGILAEVLAVPLGAFRFKGSDEAIPMSHITRTSLSARRFPSDPPKGKGFRVAEPSGGFTAAQVHLLDIISEYARDGGMHEHPGDMQARCSSSARPTSILGLARTSRLRLSLNSFWRSVDGAGSQRRAVEDVVQPNPTTLT